MLVENNNNKNYYFLSDSPYFPSFLTLKSIVQGLDTYVPIPYVIINTIVNLLCLIIFMRKPFSQLTIGFYLSCLSVADILQGLMVLINYPAISNYLKDSGNYSEIICRLFTSQYLYYTIPYYSPWILAVSSLERAITVRHIHSINYLRKRYIQIIIMVTVLVAVTLMNIDLVISYYVYDSFFSIECILDEFVTAFSIAYNAQMGSIKDAAILILLPFLIMTVSNLITSAAIIKSKKKLIKHSSVGRELKFAFTTIGLNFGFLIMYSPQFAFWFYTAFLNSVDPFEMYVDPYYYASINYTKKILYYVRSLFAPSQIIFYFIFNSVFKEELLHLFKQNRMSIAFTSIMKYSSTLKKKTLNK